MANQKYEKRVVGVQFGAQGSESLFDLCGCGRSGRDVRRLFSQAGTERNSAPGILSSPRCAPVMPTPNFFNALRGQTSEKGGIVPHYMGIEDKNGRLVTFISFNCDLGDAWEWINDPRYPVKYGLPAYKVGINVVIYAMSH